MTRLCNLWSNRVAEFRLIGQIWQNEYPERI
jgi:hypothetical protein